jgi:hypothetical protein
MAVTSLAAGQTSLVLIMPIEYKYNTKNFSGFSVLESAVVLDRVGVVHAQGS